jgi:hypothetical protein
MTAQEWGSKFVHIHQERTAKKVKAQEFTRPESLKEKLIREGKSHPDPKDPRFPQYFKDKAIKSSPQGQKENVSGDNTGGDSKDIAQTPLIVIPHPEVTPKRAGGLCTTLTNIFSPGGTKPKDSPSSESSATHVDPDLAKKIVGEGTEETTDPNANTLEDPTSDASNLFGISGDNSTEDVPSDGEVVKEHIIISVEGIETNANTEGMIPTNEGTSEAIANDPSEGLIIKHYS